MQKKCYSFKKNIRLKSKNKFQEVYKKGRTIIDVMSVLYVLPDQTENVRIGLAVGKKLGCAAVRNRIKRLMREVFRKHKAELKGGKFIIWVARRRLVKSDLNACESVFLRLIKKAGLFKE
ncbi:MAG: ribonuclease P protein component [Phascolarctobacterium sp.]|nr:ribonuclease P protein component [Phascolarctobacterium sp.]